MLCDPIDINWSPPFLSVVPFPVFHTFVFSTFLPFSGLPPSPTTGIESRHSLFRFKNVEAYPRFAGLSEEAQIKQIFKETIRVSAPSSVHVNADCDIDYLWI